MPNFVINGPDGRNFKMDIRADADPQEVINKISWIKSNWDVIGKEGSTAPESNPSVVQGPQRPSFLDLEMQPTTEVRGEKFLSPEQKENARTLLEAMKPDQAAQTQTALAEDEARLQRKISPASPIGYGVTGSISSGLTDKFTAAVNAGLYNLSKFRVNQNEKGGYTPTLSGRPIIGQPYQEALETQRILREKNWEENPVQTFLGGAATVTRLPSVNYFNPATKRGWIGNAATTGGLYGAIQGAGEGDTWQDAVLGALKGAGFGTAVGAGAGKITTKFRPQSAEEIQAIKDAEKAKVRINEAIASDDPSIQQSAGLISEAPYIGTKVKQSLQTTKGDLEKGVDRLAQDYRLKGAAPGQSTQLDKSSDVSIGDSAVLKVKNKIKKLDPQEMAKQFSTFEAELNPSIYSPMNATRQLVETLTKRDITASSTKHNPVINTVMDAITRPEGMSYAGLLEKRQEIGALLDPRLISEVGTAAPAYKELYGALSQDLKDLVRMSGKPGSVARFNKLMQDSQKAILRRQALMKIIGSTGEINPSKLVDDVARWASQGPSRNIKKLMVLKNAVGTDTMNDLAAIALHRSMLADVKSGERSITRFQKFWNGLTPQGKKLLFGQEPGLVEELTALNNTATNLDKVLKNINSSKTAYGNLLLYLLDRSARLAEKITTFAGGLLTGGATVGALMTDMGASAAAAAASLSVPLALGRLYARGLSKPATIRSLNRTYRALIKYIQAPNGAPSALAINQLRAALVELSQEAAKESGEDPRKVAKQILDAAKLPPS